MGAPAVCCYVIYQKVAISENHKAQTLSAEANSYVKKKHVFLLFVKTQYLHIKS